MAINLTDISREEWLSLRKLGSSDAAAVCGLNPWRSPFQVFAELKGLMPPHFVSLATCERCGEMPAERPTLRVLDSCLWCEWTALHGRDDDEEGHADGNEKEDEE